MALHELNRFQEKGNFLFKPEDKLAKVCNAPANSSGVYIICAINEGVESLIYIGISGRKGKSGEILHRKGGLRSRFIAGKQFGNRRQITWPQRMKQENIDALNIHWFVTYGDTDKVFPRDIEKVLIEQYQPRWNKRT